MGTCYCDSNSEVRKGRGLSTARVYYTAHVWNGQRINEFLRKISSHWDSDLQNGLNDVIVTVACGGMEGRPPIQSGHITFLWGWTTELRPEGWATSNADNVGRCLRTWGRSNGEATWCKNRRTQELRSLAGGEKPRVVLQKPLEWISLLLLFFKLTYKVVAIIIAFSYMCVLYTLL